MKIRKLLSMLIATTILVTTILVPAQAVNNTSGGEQESINELFSVMGTTDGYESEDLSRELYQTFTANPGEFVSAAAILDENELTSMAELLVYYAGYFDLDDFKILASSCSAADLSSAEQNVINTILQEIDVQQNQPEGTGLEGDVPDVPQYSLSFLDELVSAHINTGNFEDEEFLETLSTVYCIDPTTFAVALEDISAGNLNNILSGVAQKCVEQGAPMALLNKDTLTDGQEHIITALEEKIAAASKGVLTVVEN